MQALLTLTGKEISAFNRCEKIIEKGQKTFIEVGSALLEIREGRYYRSDHDTFQDYCKERWGWDRQRAFQLIKAAATVENVKNSLQGEDTPLPSNPYQAEVLSSVPSDQQPAAWQDAVDLAEERGEPVTARIVEEVAERYKDNAEPYQEPEETAEEESEEEDEEQEQKPSAGYAWWEKYIAAGLKKRDDKRCLIASWLESIAAKVRNNEL